MSPTALPTSEKRADIEPKIGYVKPEMYMNGEGMLDRRYYLYMNGQGKIIQRCADAGRFVVNFLSTIIMFVLFVYAMRSSFSRWYDELDGYTELLVPRIKDNIICNAIVFLLMLLFVFVFFRLGDKLFGKERNCRIVRWSMAVVIFILSSILVINLKAIPTYDSAEIIKLVQAVLAGNWSSFEPDGYMTCYPQQIGLFSVLYFLMKWIPGGWWYYQIINCLALAGMMLVGGALARKLWKNTYADKLYMLFQFICIPAYLYTCYVYGEIVSSFLCICTIYMVVSVSEQEIGPFKLTAIAFLMFGALWIRKNALIVMVALVLCVVWKAMAERQKSYIKIVLALLLSMGIYKVSGNLMFSNHIEHYDSLPAVAWVVMGMEKNAMGYGGYNGFTNATFIETGYNAKLTKQKSYERIGEILEYYAERPKEAIVFVKEKVLFQWTDPSFESLFWTKEFHNGGFLRRVYFGDLRLPVWNLINWYQNLIYFGLLFAFIYEWRNKNKGLQIIFQVIFLGYFFFSIIWEAKPRYMVMCYIMMLPMAAYGIGQFCRETETLMKKMCRKGKEEE